MNVNSSKLVRVVGHCRSYMIFKNQLLGSFSSPFLFCVNEHMLQPYNHEQA